MSIVNAMTPSEAESRIQALVVTIDDIRRQPGMKDHEKDSAIANLETVIGRLKEITGPRVINGELHIEIDLAEAFKGG